MKDQLQGLSNDEIKALAKKQLEQVRKRREYQNAWRHKNKDKVAKYNKQYQMRKTIKQLST